MSEVTRWKLKGFIPGIEGETRALFQPTVVLAQDYDAALAREVALREELATSRTAFKEELDGVKYTRRKFRQERDALQQSLTDAEKRVGDLKSLLREGLEEPKEGDDYIGRVIEALKE